ncbi:MAG: pyridoxal-phosphate dependent enzyme, partial [Gemmatimonadota bacterium]|nr:pyridoxal-phosphate dependent enzyme [Gemmatimonadota bacterium]
EPEAADCLLASARQGRPTPSAGSLSTVMAGLSCRHVSTLAWPILERGVHGFMTVPDSAVFPTMRALASGLAGTPVEGGESGVVGLVGLQVAASDPDLRSALGLNEGSRTLVFNTEGATDPGLYRQVIEEDRGPCPTSQVG